MAFRCVRAGPSDAMLLLARQRSSSWFFLRPGCKDSRSSPFASQSVRSMRVGSLAQPLLVDTGSPHPIVRLGTGGSGSNTCEPLIERTWYEFKVVAVNASGSSPMSPASQPIQTLAAPMSAAAAAAAGAAAAAAADAAAALAEELQIKSPRLMDSENQMIEREDPELLTRYAQCKRDLLAWEANFDKANGRVPTEMEKAKDLTYQTTLVRYKKLKHAKRKLLRGVDAHPSPRPLDGDVGSPFPGGIGSPFAASPCSCVENGGSSWAASSNASSGIGGVGNTRSGNGDMKPGGSSGGATSSGGVTEHAADGGGSGGGVSFKGVEGGGNRVNLSVSPAAERPVSGGAKGNKTPKSPKTKGALAGAVCAIQRCPCLVSRLASSPTRLACTPSLQPWNV